MSGLLQSYFQIPEDWGEHSVCCPFPHTYLNGQQYLETVPSAHINTEKGVYHCKVCDRRYNNTTFAQYLLGCNKREASQLATNFLIAQDGYEWDKWELTPESRMKALNYGISDKVIDELKIKTNPISDDNLCFPVFMFGQLLDHRTYTPNQRPKVTSLSGSTTGLIIPFDEWIKSSINRTTIICAGEKDMAIARSYGFNAITITGGERALPKALKYFKGRRVVICYDNDKAGKEGAISLATALYGFAEEIKIVTGFHSVCVENGEDITDFFQKYEKTKEDLIKFIKETPVFKPSEVPVPSMTREYPQVNLYEASQKYVGQIVQSNIQVVATSDTAFQIPKQIIAVKKKDTEGVSSDLKVGDSVTWDLNEKTCSSILYMMDSGLKESQIYDNIRRMVLKLPAERHLDIDYPKVTTAYKVAVTDLYETAERNVQPMEYSAYSVGIKLESGKKYNITYKLEPHPLKGNQLIMIIMNATQASDSISSFQITPEVKNNLKMIQNLPGTIAEKIDTLVEMQKQFIGFDANNDLIKMIDFAFNTPLRFHFGNQKNIRGYLDILIVGESRTGKSSTADALRKLYNLGTFTSLAGNSATIPGLVGGSSKTTSGTMQTRAGVIPQNHTGLIIFEEFGKSNKDVIRELTDIRSSNEVRISRVSGTTILPAWVRMIALTNTKTNGEIKPIKAYPNGISIITELVSTAEDIARYDAILIMRDEGPKDIDPLWQPKQAFNEQAYKDRIRWIWTRDADDIYTTPELQKYIIEKSNELNRTYPCHIKLFGTEAWKKIQRLAMAVAAYVVSASEDFTKLIVTKECIDYTINFLVSLYDNETFRFKEYVENELRYTVTDDDAVAALQAIYNKTPSLVLQLEQQINITKSMLESTTGLDATDLRNGLKALTQGYFIKVDNSCINPTERFRATVNRLNKNTEIRRVGE